MQYQVMTVNRQYRNEPEIQWACWKDVSGVKAFAVQALGAEFRSPETNINDRRVWQPTCNFSLRTQSKLANKTNH